MRTRHHPALACLLALAAACEPDETAKPPAYDANVPMPEIEIFDSAAIERARLDDSWRTHAEYDRRRRLGERPGPDGPPGAAPGPVPDGAPTPPDGTLVRPDRLPPTPAEVTPQESPRTTEDGATTDTTAAATPPGATVGAGTTSDVPGSPASPGAPVPGGVSVLHVQVLLDRLDFSPGAIDGNWGQNTEKAVFWFQHEQGLEATGLVDSTTYARLVEMADDRGPIARYRIEEDDIDGPFRTIPPGIYDKATLDCLCYASPIELLAERFHTTPELLRSLNPQVDFEMLAAGDVIHVPNTRGRRLGAGVDRIVISRRGSYTHALDDDGRIVFHFPSVLGSRYAPSPTGEYEVVAVVPWPRFHYTPDLYYDVPDTRPEAVLPPGPNSPIGGTWIELSKPTYGIHGTSAPSSIGSVTSHGCVRLTNWDAYALGESVHPGTPVEFR